MSTLSKIANRFNFFVSNTIALDNPHPEVRAEMMKQGWTFRTAPTTQEEAANIIAAGPTDSGVGALCLPAKLTKIFSPEGEEVFSRERNKPLEARYKAEVRKAATQVYGIQ
jgi:hypothetical protein